MNKILLCPDSVVFWAPKRMSKSNRNIPIVSRSEFDTNNGVAGLLSRYKNLEEIVIVSSHESFLEDIDLRGQFNSKGIKVHCQSSFACSLAVNKIAVKKMLDENKIASIDWSTESSHEIIDFVVKKNDGSIGKGTRYYYKNMDIELDNEFIEAFVEGDEYSVNVFTDKAGNSIVFPSVYKGITGRDMVHPSSKIRVCSNFEDFSGIVNQMNDMAVRVAKLIENIGFMEVEFIVDSSGKVLILEINPRVSGTLRMASMACDSMCFDLLLDETMMKCNKRLECVHNVLEIPCLGRNFSSEEQDIICTTRASFCFNDLDEMVSKIKTVKRMEEKCYIDEAKNIVLEKLPQTI